MSGNREVTDDAYVWVPGQSEESYESDSESFELVTDKATYAPGDTARVAVRGTQLAPPVDLRVGARRSTGNSRGQVGWRGAQGPVHAEYATGTSGFSSAGCDFLI